MILYHRSENSRKRALFLGRASRGNGLIMKEHAGGDFENLERTAAKVIAGVDCPQGSWQEPRRLGLGGGVLIGGWLAAALGIGLIFGWRVQAGIPEPDLVWYGKVLGNAGGVAVRVTTGELVWRVETMAGDLVMTRTTQLTNINDQFSFILRLPCETLEPGVPASAGVLPLLSTPTAYLRTNVMLNGVPLVFRSVPGQFAVELAGRGRLERVDLALGTLPLDSDGNGLADAWEQQFFGRIGVDPHADPDGDGLNNLREYRAGTNPNDPQSRFEIVNINPVPGGIQLLWSSEPLRTYRVRRSSTLLGPPSAYEVIRSGLAATPPFNQFVDTNVTGPNTGFYVIQIEE